MFYQDERKIVLIKVDISGGGKAARCTLKLISLTFKLDSKVVPSMKRNTRLPLYPRPNFALNFVRFPFLASGKLPHRLFESVHPMNCRLSIRKSEHGLTTVGHWNCRCLHLLTTANMPKMTREKLLFWGEGGYTHTIFGATRPRSHASSVQYI